MEALLFIGIQGAGKSTYYQENFFRSHMRISLDLYNTRNKERQFLEKALELRQKIVIDNTNVSVEERQKFMAVLKLHKYSIIGYVFEVDIDACLQRNQQRKESEIVPKKGVLGTVVRYRKPTFEEGFDRLYYVTIRDASFTTKEIIKKS